MKFAAKEEYVTPPKTVRVQCDEVGLPRKIPKVLRSFLSRGDRNYEVLRACLSIVAVYRVVKVKSLPKLSTITDPCTGTETLPLSELKCVIELFPKREALRDTRFPIISSAGANHSISTFGAGLDALAYFKDPRQLGYLLRYYMNSKAYMHCIVFLCSALLTLPGYVISRAFGWLSPLKLGRLHEKVEAAGKIRIFAIANYWLQAALGPLHDELFRILRLIPQDGTFNQTGPLDLLKARLSSSSEVYSLDLSAATDRLPRKLQRDIISLLLGNPKIAHL